MDSYTPTNELSEHMLTPPAYDIFDGAIESSNYKLFSEKFNTFCAHANFDQLIGLSQYIQQKKDSGKIRYRFILRVLSKAITLINQGTQDAPNCDQFVEKYNHNIANTGDEYLNRSLTLSATDLYMLSIDGTTIHGDSIEKVFLLKVFSTILSINPPIEAYHFFWDLYNDPNFLDAFSKKTFLSMATSSSFSDLVKSKKSPLEIAFKDNQVKFLREQYPDKKHYAWLLELKITDPTALHISLELDQLLHEMGILDKDEIKTDAYYQKRKKMHGANGEENYKRLMHNLKSLPQCRGTSEALLKAFKFNHAFSSHDEQSIINHGLMSPKEAIEKGFKKKSTTPGITVNSTVFGYGFSDPPLHKGGECDRVLHIPTSQLDNKHSWASHHLTEYTNNIESNSYKFYGKEAGCFTTIGLLFNINANKQKIMRVSLYYSFKDDLGDLVTKTKIIKKPFNDEVYAGDLSKIMLGVFYERAFLLKHEDDHSKSSPLERILEEPPYAVAAAKLLMTRRTFELHYDQIINVNQPNIAVNDNPKFELNTWYREYFQAIAMTHTQVCKELISKTPDPFIYTTRIQNINVLAELFKKAITVHTSFTLSAKQEKLDAIEGIIERIISSGFYSDKSETPKTVCIPFLFAGARTEQTDKIESLWAIEEILSLDIYSKHLKEIIISYIDEHASLIPQSVCNYLLLFFDNVSLSILDKSEKRFTTYKMITAGMREKINMTSTDALENISAKRALVLHKTIHNKPIKTKNIILKKSLVDLYIIAKNKIPLAPLKGKQVSANTPPANIILFLLKYNVEMSDILDFIEINTLQDIDILLQSIISAIEKPGLIKDKDFELIEKHILNWIKDYLSKNLLKLSQHNNEFSILISYALQVLSHKNFTALINLVKEKAVLTTSARPCINVLLCKNVKASKPDSFQKNIELYFEHTIGKNPPLKKEERIAIVNTVALATTNIITNKIASNTVASYTILEILRQEERKNLGQNIEIAYPLQTRNLLAKTHLRILKNGLGAIDTAYCSDIFRKIIIEFYAQPDMLVQSLMSSIYSLNNFSIEKAYYHCKNYVKYFNCDLRKNPFTCIILKLFDDNFSKDYSIPTTQPSELKTAHPELYIKLCCILHMMNALVTHDETIMTILKDCEHVPHIDDVVFIAFPLAREKHTINNEDIDFFFKNLLPSKIGAEVQNPAHLLEVLFVNIKNAIDYINSDTNRSDYLSNIASPEKIYTKTQIQNIIDFFKNETYSQDKSFELLKKIHPKNLTLVDVQHKDGTPLRTNLLSRLLLLAIEDCKQDDDAELVLGAKTQYFYDVLKTPLIKSYLQDNQAEVFLSLEILLTQLVNEEFNHGQILIKFLLHFLGDFGFTQDSSKKLIFYNHDIFDPELQLEHYIEKIQSVEKNKITHINTINYFHINSDGTLLCEKNICALTLFYLLDLTDQFKAYLNLVDTRKSTTTLAISNVFKHISLPLSEKKNTMLRMIPTAYKGKKIFKKNSGQQACGIFSLILNKTSTIKQALINLYYPFIISDPYLKKETHPAWLEQCLKDVPEEIKEQHQVASPSKRKSSSPDSRSKKSRVSSTESKKSTDESDVASSSSKKTRKDAIKPSNTTSLSKRSRTSPRLFSAADDGAAAAADPSSKSVSASTTAMKLGD